MMGRMDGEPSLGAQIRDARDRKGWTQQDLARALGVNKKTVNNWENDRVSAPRRSLVVIEDVLAPYFRAAPPARRTAADEMTDTEREEAMQEFLRLGRQLFGDDGASWPQRRGEPEDKPPQDIRRAANA
jgi:transcriptional regulator with XRE-family HTH domain